MPHDLRPGMTHVARLTATRDLSAEKLGNTGVAVLATPALVSVAEQTCVLVVRRSLDDGEATVGIRLDVRHLAATPIGMDFTMTATLREIDGRRLVFDVTGRDAQETIFDGVHERMIIDLERFMQRVERKRGSMVVEELGP